MRAFGDWIKNWRANRRKKRELKALDLLRRLIEREKKQLTPMGAVVKKIEVEVNEGRYEEAERMVPSLVSLMKEKKALDRLEEEEFKKFKKTMFKELRAEMRRVR